MRKAVWGSGVRFVLGMAAAIVLTVPPAVSAQETTGGIKAYVKDKTGASIPKASVELSGTGLITPQKLEADDAGYVYFTQVPPGEYTLSASAPNFRIYKVTGISLNVGKLPTFDIVLEVGEISQTIEVTSQPVQVDVTSSKVAVAIPEDVIENIPKGRSYQSLIPFAPGARQEPLQSSRVDRGRANGFQIDGASDSENTYLVEGLDTSNIQNGGVKQNVIFEFVKEVQVKTSGFEAEYGGAMGGVVNVVQKRGGNDWHGGLVSYYQSNAFDANDQCTTTPQPSISEVVTPPVQQIQCGQRANPATATNPTIRLDQSAQYYLQNQDRYKILEAGYDVGGPLIKDKLWFFSSYLPTIDRETRTVNFTGAVNPGPRSFTRSFTAHNMLNRLDYQLSSRLRLFGGWQYGYSRIAGILPSIPDSIIGQTNTVATSDPTQFRPDTGSVNPSNIFNFGGDWVPNSRTVISARYGYFYYNTSDRGKPIGVRDIFQRDLGIGTTLGINGAPLIPTASSPGAQFAHGTLFANIAPNLQTIFDVFSRKALSTDLSYFLSRWGTHNFKIGYGFNHLANNVVNGFNTAQVLLFWGEAYVPKTATGTTNCNTIIAANGTTYGTPAQAASAGCRGNAGYFLVRDGTITAGKADSYNHGIYVQDSWTVGRGLTLNLGVRFDKEFVPPFNDVAPSVRFDFDQKIAPRIGGSYDLFRNGKVKVFASYGKFFDIMKYSLPRGSFGGEYWHDCAYAIDTPDFTTVTPTNPGGHSCSGNSTTPAPGVSATNVRFIENQNWRASAGSATDPGVDPNIKPMSQHEFVVGSDWAIRPKVGLEIRYVRKRLDQAIEDISIDDSTYYIGNPGPNVYADLLHRTTALGAPQCLTCPAQPVATRRYDGLETRLSYRGANLFGQLSYTRSSLTGNYAGLTDTDVTDGNGGRHSPNNHRAYDIPAMEFTSTGALNDGPLGTDRPHVLSMVGYYRLKWWGMESTLGVNQIFASGTPTSTCIPVVASTSSCQYFEQRGTFASMHRDPTNGNLVVDNVIRDARTPMYSGTDLNFGHQFRVSKNNEAMRLGFELNVANLFNQASVLAVNPIPFQGADTTVTPRTSAGAIDWTTLLKGWNPIAAANAQDYNITSPMIFNARYGLPYLFQTRRNMRIAIRFTF